MSSELFSPAAIFFGAAVVVVVGVCFILFVGGIIEGYRAGPNGLPPKPHRQESGPVCANRDCNLAHPPEARYCRRCGQPLPHMRRPFDDMQAA